MEPEISKKLAKKLGQRYQEEFPIAIDAIKYVNEGMPQIMVAASYNAFGQYLHKMSAAEYLTKRDLWDFIK
jgi:hypothetical protein